ncbi:CCR4-NOT transcription complex subunit 10-B [Polypedilum vanderplanki]|uniref:CCR4-NOT transcription complex subunit 10 n=1 Tax=Polypedilum vanderplanki TaxID=319348 RepID=A0A9J6BS35_POLVA|nr:CCR4-NOT transcription complex subunit 10-B [Polypedilum vanderplanki]
MDSEFLEDDSDNIAEIKAAHDRAVNEFYKSDLKKCDQFKKALSSLTGLNDTQPIQNVEISSIELCPLYYNYAVVLYHQKKLNSALKIMNAILHHAQVDNMSNKFLEKAGLLTVCILLDTNQAKKADNLLETLQNRLNLNNDDILMVEEDVLESEQKKQEELDEDQETFRRQFRLALIRSKLNSGKLNAVVVPQDETSSYAILKAHQFYLLNDFQMSAKELSKPFKNEPITLQNYGEEQNVCVANNMGLIHFNVKHYSLAVRFFQQALQFDHKALENVRKENNNQLPLHCLGATRRSEILYNLGIALLYLQRPKDAFDCLLVPLNVYHKNPRLWLRVAESCIMVHRQHLKEQESQNKNIVSSVIGSGMHRKYIITPSQQKYTPDEIQSSSSAIPSPNLEFASLCLRNALTLVEHCRQLLTTVDEEVTCNPSKPLTKTSIEKLQLHILTASSYVALCLGDYTLALYHARELLKIENLPDTHKMMGFLYAAESCIMLDRVPEAIAYLDPKILMELKSTDFETVSSPDWNINTLEAVNAVYTYNLAVSLAIYGDYELAKTRIVLCRHHPVVAVQTKMLELYLEMQSGNIENCKKKIAIDTPQYF